MKNRVIIRTVLAFFCIFSFSYGKSAKDANSILVAQTVGRAISHQSFRAKGNVRIDTSIVQKVLDSYLKERGFSFKLATLLSQKQNGKKVFIKGVAIYTDKLTRSIQTEFKIRYELANRRLIVVKDIKLKNLSKPRGVFFIVPASKMKTINLTNLAFNRAFQKVYDASRKLNDFNVDMDTLPVSYKIVVFMMSKLDSEDEVYALFSNSPYSQKGQISKSLKTRDGWRVLMLGAKFRYNADTPMYINLLWQKGDYLIPLESYSTQGLIKSMQIALRDKGYDVGVTDGRLNAKTQKAIRKYLVNSGFYKNSRLSDDLLWFMQQYNLKNVSKIVQASLLLNGINIGSIDGQIGPRTTNGIKKYQKEFGIQGSGKITPELVRLLIQTSKNIVIYDSLKNYFDKPVVINNFLGKMWPNEL